MPTSYHLKPPNRLSILGPPPVHQAARPTLSLPKSQAPTSTSKVQPWSKDSDPISFFSGSCQHNQSLQNDLASGTVRSSSWTNNLVLSPVIKGVLPTPVRAWITIQASKHSTPRLLLHKLCTVCQHRVILGIPLRWKRISNLMPSLPANSRTILTGLNTFAPVKQVDKGKGSNGRTHRPNNNDTLTPIHASVAHINSSKQSSQLMKFKASEKWANRKDHLVTRTAATLTSSLGEAPSSIRTTPAITITQTMSPRRHPWLQSTTMTPPPLAILKTLSPEKDSIRSSRLLMHQLTAEKISTSVHRIVTAST